MLATRLLWSSRRAGATVTSLALLCGAMVLGVVSTDWTPGPAAAFAAEKDGAGEKLDRIVLRNGRVIIGRILEENATTVRVMVVLAGIQAPASYPADQVASIERGVITPEGGDADANDDDDDFDTPRDRAASDGPLVFRIKLEGLLISSSGVGRPPREPVIAPSTLRRALEDAASYDPEVVIVEFDVTAPSGLGGVLLVEDYGAVVEPFVEDGMRIVFWVERATGGAGLLPFSVPEVYFRPGGVMGGLGEVGEIDRGDEWVNKKLLSAALGHAGGMAIKGGYAPEVIRAMCVESNWLAVRFDGGRVEFIEYEPRPADGDGWIILTDDGEGANEDDEDELDQNDVLNLDADWAYRLGVSKGQFDELDDLVWELGIDDDYVIETGKATSILESAADQVERTIDARIRLQQEIDDLGGNDPARLLNLLKRLSGLFAAQSEVLDPNGTQRAGLEIQIQRLREEIRDLNEREKNSRRRRR